MKHLLLLPAFAILGALPSFATPQCGDPVSGAVTLTADLACNNQSGLVVSASNTTINLNGHTLSCTGGGVGGTCQPVAGSSNIAGIRSANFSNVKILGPGVITGFGTGVYLEKGTAFTVSNVEITGPATTMANNNRYMSYGIFIDDAACPISIFGSDTTPAALVTFNQISNQSSGILVRDSGCVKIAQNVIHDINRINVVPNGYYATGMDLIRVSNSTVSYNSVTGVGYNFLYEAAVRMTAGNKTTLYGNNFSNNCSNGLLALWPNNTNVYGNVMKLNGTSSMSGACNAPGASNYDLNWSGNGNGNIFNPSNVCRTQSVSVAPGVCNPNE